MTRRRSQLEPQSPYWYEDLPDRNAQLNEKDKRDRADIGVDLRHIDDQYLEISRATSMQRGLGLFLGSAMLLGLLSFSGKVFEMILGGFPEAPGIWTIFTVALVVFVVAVVFLIKKEIRTPRDLPVRFYRKEGCIVSLEYVTSYNPFAKWKVVSKRLDWSRAEAEIAKIAGYNGKVYLVRYALLLAQCEQDSKKVESRIVLKADEPFPIILHRMWAYVRRYMAQGAQGLGGRARPTDIRLVRCLLTYYPILDFTSEGPERRKELGVVGWIFNSVILLPLIWLFIPVGIFEYIALRLAPEVEWPAEAMLPRVEKGEGAVGAGAKDDATAG